MPLYKVVLKPVSKKLELEENFLDRIDIATGYDSVVFFKYGEIKSAGRNQAGQLGTNNLDDKGYATCIAGSKRVYCKIGFSISNVVLIDKQGQAWAWATNNYGQLGTNNTTSYLTPVAVCGNHVFCEITTGMGNYFLALDHSSKAWSWGQNNYGQLGTNNTTCYSTPVAVYGNHTFCKISSGAGNLAALDNLGKAWAWGLNNSGQLGRNNTVSRKTPVAVCGTHTFCQISLGNSHTVALDNNGKAWSWGEGGYGKLGINTISNRSTPVAVCGNKTFCKISGGYSHSAALDYNGKAWAWGKNDSGQVGDNTTPVCILTPNAVHGNHTFCKIYCGNEYTIGVDKNGKTWGWGYKKNIGLGLISNSPLMTYITKTFCDIFNFSGTANYAIALDNHGKTWGWGQNYYGVLGVDDTSDRSTPEAVCGTHTFCKISAGDRHVMSIDNHGKAWGWGYNDNGQLGRNNTTSYLTPVAVCGNHTFCQVFAGTYNSYCIDYNGKLWSWGQNNSGQLGRNNTTAFKTPVAVCGAHTFCQISGRQDYVLAIDVHNMVFAWGSNYYGQLGRNNTTCYSTPVAVCGTHTFCKIITGVIHSIGVDYNGKAWSWGGNSFGQLGRNNTTSYLTPVAVCGNHTFCKVSGGQYHNIFIDNHNKPWGWGYNGDGRLGIKTNSSVSTPVSVEINTTFCKIESGSNSISIDNHGRTWAWGYPSISQAVNLIQRTPIEITDSTKKHRVYLYCNYEISSINAGDKYTIILNNKGHAWGFGSNDKGQLGTGSANSGLVSSGNKLIASDINKITGNLLSTLCLDNKGKAWGWGYNESGELGINDTDSKVSPVAVCGNHIFCEISTGDYHTAAIDSMGKAWAWGDNYIGQLGTNNTTCYSTPVAVCGTHTFCKISCGFAHTVAMDNNGKLWSWGKNDSGQLGRNNTTCYSTPVAVCGGYTFCKISTGGNVSGGIDIYSHVFMWGSGAYGQIGNEDFVNVCVPTYVQDYTNYECSDIEIDSAGYNAFGVAKYSGNGSWAWGYNQTENLGINDTTKCISQLLPICGNHNFCKISAGFYHTLGFDKNNNVWGWGAKIFLGIGLSYDTPIRIACNKTFQSIYGGEHHAMGLDNNGNIWSWGINTNGVLGANITVDTCKFTPVQVYESGSQTFCKISCGYTSALAIDKNGKAWAWGFNNNGQLGTNNTAQYSTPAAVCGAHTFCEIKINQHFSIGLDKNGKAWCWGLNTYGQLGNNITLPYQTPVAVCGGHTFCKIALGLQQGTFSVAIDNHGMAWSWGRNNNGQLGTNNTTNYSQPVAVCGNHTFCQVFCGTNHSVCIDYQGNAWAFGANTVGQLGTGDSSGRSTPSAVYGNHIFCKINASGLAVLAIDENDISWSWGFDVYSQLGFNKESTLKNTPVRICGNHTFSFISISLNNSFAIDNNGKSWGWGCDFGDGTDYANILFGGLGDNPIYKTPVNINFDYQRRI